MNFRSRRLIVVVLIIGLRNSQKDDLPALVGVIRLTSIYSS